VTEASAAFPCLGAECAALVGGDGALGSAQDAVAIVRERLAAWHERFTRFSTDSELSRLNADPRRTVAVSPAMARFVAAVRAAAELTGGIVDATLIDALELAGYDRDLRTSIPLGEALATAPERRPAGPSPRSRWRGVAEATGTAIRPPGVRLDSGGLAKGLFADMLAETLESHASFAVDCAGDLRVGGRDRLPRRVQVASPFGDGVLHTFELTGAGIATSGIGRRSWRDPTGALAHHLLDPATGRPAFTGVVQVTALAPGARGRGAGQGGAALRPGGGARLAAARRRRRPRRRQPPRRPARRDALGSPAASQATPRNPTTMDHVTDSDQPHRVLVVDDEPNIVDVVAMALRFHGFAVDTAATGEEAMTRAAAFRPHLMVLDVMLPDMEGFDVARRLGAQRTNLPIIFLTARDATEDKIRGLTTGGDDYVTKPFSLEELIARIRTVLRRTGAAEPESSRLVHEDLELDDDTREVTRAGNPIELTATEYRLLRYLMLNPRRVLTRAQLLDHVWSYDFGGDARVLETYVSYLRKKLDLHGPPLIQTVRGVGYALRLPRA